MDTLCLPARIESLARFRDFVLQKLQDGNVSRACYPKVELILEEILTNVFNYAYAGGRGDAELACELRNGMLQLRVADRGRPFNPLEATPPNLTGDIQQRDVGGLGIYFVMKTVDKIAYERRDGRNIITLSYTIPK